MVAWVCADCTTVYSVDAPRCPHCGSTTYTEEGEMPKITRYGGATNGDAAPSFIVGATWSDGDAVDEWPDLETAGAVTEPPASTAPAPNDEGGAPSPGSSSSASSETEQPSSEQSETAPRSPARKTASRSKKAQTADSSAPSTDGDPTDSASDQ